MGFWVSRTSRPFIALAMLGMGPVACSSASPTAPSSLSARDGAADAVTASASSASATGAGAQSAAADTIKITQGTIALEAERPGSVTLRGSHGFTFEGRTLSGLDPSYSCGATNPCQPGAVVAFTATWVGSDLPGMVRLQGDEFEVGRLDGASMAIELTGSFVAPAHVAETASVTVPFAVSGLLLPGFPLSNLELTGTGQVTLRLEWQSAIGGGWAVRFSSFDFGGGRPN
jgi:hypothetical protein